MDSLGPLLGLRSAGWVGVGVVLLLSTGDSEGGVEVDGEDDAVIVVVVGGGGGVGVEGDKESGGRGGWPVFLC